MTRLILVYAPGAVLAKDLPEGLEPFDTLFVIPPDGDETTIPLLAGIGDVLRLRANAPSAEDLVACRRFGPDGVATFSESTLPLAITLADILGLPQQGPIDRLTDKFAQRQALRANSVDRTRSLVLDDLSSWKRVAAEIGLPVILKPLQGAGSRNTFPVRSIEDGERLAALIRTTHPEERLVVEEMLRDRPSGPFGSYVSVESVVVAGDVAHLGVTGKLPQFSPFRETGQFFPSTLDPTEQLEVEDLATRAVRAVGLRNGVAHTEIKMTPDGPRVIEVNGRLGGYINELYSRGLGVNVVTLAARVASGEQVMFPRPASIGVFYQYFHQPPSSATELLRVDGARAVRRARGVDRYDTLVRPGTRLPNGHASYDLDLVCGRAPTHEDMLDDLAQVHSLLTFHFVLGGKEVEMNGARVADQPHSALGDM